MKALADGDALGVVVAPRLRRSRPPPQRKTFRPSEANRISANKTRQTPPPDEGGGGGGAA